MEEIKVNLDDLSKGDLIHMIERQQREYGELAATLVVYQKHLEQTIEYRSIESYCETVRRNRETEKHFDYYGKLERLINDRESEAIEWRQSNKEIDGMTVSEVTFKFRQPTLEKK